MVSVAADCRGSHNCTIRWMVIVSSLWDMPGYGASAPLDAAVTFTTLADAVVDFLDVLGSDAAHLAGISFGGMIAQYVTAGTRRAC